MRRCGAGLTLSTAIVKVPEIPYNGSSASQNIIETDDY